ncbi:MAG: acyl carrier protein [Frankiaceae bacterium]
MSTIDLAEQTLGTVLDIARQVAQGQVDEGMDPITAGFDSIATMELAMRLEEELGVDCTLEDVLDSPSFGELARTLVRRLDAAGSR